ncbi:glycerophosphodiester phosphodiesterase family protein [Altererythrobacter sp. MF3-039]|uniref:glycerophosphodiester phosphodiesterase family protein n=1 Tax=Altererythrobacter sp. MF3-039 TaxID=3252901 RepID=UPI00390C554D
MTAKYLKVAALFLALGALVLSIINASWLAPEPLGSPKLIAHRGLAQIHSPKGIGRDTCTATLIEAPYHGYLENTVKGALRAHRLGAAMIEVDIAATSDGEIAVFHDWTLECRTDGKGNIRDAALADLKALDIGHGYSADGGETFPFRGKAVGMMPSLEELIRAMPKRARIMFNFKSGDVSEADLLANKLNSLGRDPVEHRDAFYGHEAPVSRIKEHFPEVWAWRPEKARACSEDYVLLGWTGILPQSCRGGTLIIPLNYQWAFWGWPNRVIARMEEHGGQIIVTAPYERGEANQGLTFPEQLGEIPSSFNGYVWVEDGFTVIPALFPSLDNRTADEVMAAAAALETRRKTQ